MIDFGKKPMWNDGPPLIDFMGRDGAPSIASRHLCFGGGGSSAPNPPDYSQYIAATTAAANTGLGRSSSLYDWAGQQGQAIQTTANQVSGQAGDLAAGTMGVDPSLEANWESTYGPLYQAQATDAKQMNANLPATEEQWAGKYEADTGQAFDAAKASQTRALQGYGLKSPGLASEALDMTSANQRAAAIAAAGETGRLAADTTARNLTNTTLQTGTAIPQIGASQAGVGLAAGNQQVNAPESAISTTAGAYSPSLGFYSAAQPYLGQWGSTMANSYNQQLGQFNANQNSSSGTGAILGTIGGLAGTAIGAYFGGPMGATAGGAAGKSLGSAAGGMAKGGMVYADGGGVAPAGPNYVPPDASQSRGAITDDVPARLNVGEFVFPKDVVAWRGEQWAHKEIMKARQEREKMTAESGAEPGEGPEQAPQEHARGGAIHTMPPTPRFVSEGARA